MNAYDLLILIAMAFCKQCEEETIQKTEVATVSKTNTHYPLVYQTDIESEMRIQILNKLDLYYKEVGSKDCDFLKFIDDLDSSYGKKWHCGPIKSEASVPVCPYINGTLLICSPDGRGRIKILIWRQDCKDNEDSFCFCS